MPVLSDSVYRGVMWVQCQLNLMSCLILMLVHFDKIPSWQKKTHSLQPNHVFLFFFFFFVCAYLSSSSQHTVTLGAPAKRLLPLLLSRRLQSGRDQFDRRRPRRPIFLSCYEEKPFRGSNGKPVWPQSAKQRAHLEGGFARGTHTRRNVQPGSYLSLPAARL